MSHKCKMCGTCCKAIHVPISYEEFMKKYEYGKKYGFARDKEGYNDFDTIYEIWEPITLEEAFKINPYFKETGLDYSSFYFYTCKMYDEITHKCLIQESKPKVCRDFPWYGNRPNVNDPLYSKNCSFQLSYVEKLYYLLRNKLLPLERHIVLLQRKIVYWFRFKFLKKEKEIRKERCPNENSSL